MKIPPPLQRRYKNFLAVTTANLLRENTDTDEKSRDLVGSLMTEITLDIQKIIATEKKKYKDHFYATVSPANANVDSYAE